MATTPSSPLPDPAYLAENCSGGLVAAIACILTLSTLFLALRLYARTLTSANRGWDEYLLPIAWIFLVGICANDIRKIFKSAPYLHWGIAHCRGLWSWSQDLELDGMSSMSP